MNLDALYSLKDALQKYPERQFLPLRHPVGLHNPVVFVNDHRALADASYFNLNTMDDTGYAIYIITYESGVLLYVIDVKTNFYKLVKNGLIVRTRKRWNELTDSKGIAVRYQLNDFVVLSNANQTAAVFSRNITSDPKT